MWDCNDDLMRSTRLIFLVSLVKEVEYSNKRDKWRYECEVLRIAAN